MEIYNEKKERKKLEKRQSEKSRMDEIDLAKNPQVLRGKQSNEDVAEFIENVSKCELIKDFN
jgi:hypothetical protein